MARVGMATLINQVERLINDSANAFWSADQVQDGLDRNRRDVHQAQLGYVTTQTSSGTQYLSFFYGRNLRNRYGNWASDLVIYDSSYADVTSGFTPDYITGLFVRTSTSLNPPAFITGASYDLYGAAVYLLTEKLASVAPNYAFSAGGQSFSANQEYEMWAKLLEQHTRKMRAQTVGLHRADFSPYGGLPQVAGDGRVY
jgi:hypothetical protein